MERAVQGMVRQLTSIQKPSQLAPSTIPFEALKLF